MTEDKPSPPLRKYTDPIELLKREALSVRVTGNKIDVVNPANRLAYTERMKEYNRAIGLLVGDELKRIKRKIVKLK